MKLYANGILLNAAAQSVTLEKSRGDAAATLTAVLLTAAGAAAALVPQDTKDRDSGQSAPAVLMEPRGTEDEAEVILDGPG